MHSLFNTWRKIVNRKETLIYRLYCAGTADLSDIAKKFENYLRNEMRESLKSSASNSKQEEANPSVELVTKPKKPPVIFMRYFNSIKKKLRAENPGVNAMDLRILAGKQWLKTDANIKRPLQIAYYTELEQYNKELYEYQQSLDEEQLSEGKLHKTKELQGKKYRNFLEQKLKKLKLPTLNVTPYQVFLAQKEKIMSPEEFQEYRKIAKQEYKSLSKEARTNLKRTAKRLTTINAKKLKNWMNEKVNVDNLRNDIEDVKDYAIEAASKEELLNIYQLILRLSQNRQIEVET